MLAPLTFHWKVTMIVGVADLQCIQLKCNQVCKGSQVSRVSKEILGWLERPVDWSAGGLWFLWFSSSLTKYFKSQKLTEGDLGDQLTGTVLGGYLLVPGSYLMILGVIWCFLAIICDIATYLADPDVRTAKKVNWHHKYARGSSHGDSTKI